MLQTEQKSDAIGWLFIFGAIVLGMTTGAFWGGILLYKIGSLHSFTDLSVQDINAHGHAQVFGWTGLVLMGLGYKLFPKFWKSELRFSFVAYAIFSLLVGGVLIRSSGMVFYESRSWAIPLARIGSLFEVIAITLFVLQMVATYLKSKSKKTQINSYIFTAMGCLFLMSIFSYYHMTNTLLASSQDDLLWYVGTYQAPLRDLQIHGFILFMILGCSLAVLPTFYSLPVVPSRAVGRSYFFILVALISEMTLFLLYRFTTNHYYSAALLIPWALLLMGVWQIVKHWKLWQPFPEKNNTNKFITVSYTWLLLSLLMLLVFPLYQTVSGIAFSHAYYGAIRHAITVGFASLFIMGITVRVIPNARAHWLIFLTLNVGCLWRVSMQILTDWSSIGFLLIRFSALFEMFAFVFWGIHLIQNQQFQQRIKYNDIIRLKNECV